MSAANFDELREHIGHRVVCAAYGPLHDPANVALECEDCSMVLLDYDNAPDPRFAQNEADARRGGAR